VTRTIQPFPTKLTPPDYVNKDVAIFENVPQGTNRPGIRTETQQAAVFTESERMIDLFHLYFSGKKLSCNSKLRLMIMVLGGYILKGLF
jgi:hypothetical protein